MGFFSSLILCSSDATSALPDKCAIEIIDLKNILITFNGAKGKYLGLRLLILLLSPALERVCYFTQALAGWERV